MKNLLKSYLPFIPSIYKIFVFIIYPIFTIVLFAIPRVLFKSSWIITPVIISIIVESFFESITFGGMANKYSSKIEYLKTSKRGMKIFQNVLIIDCIRKLIRLLLIDVFCIIIDLISQAKFHDGIHINIIFMITITLFAYGLIMLGNIVTKFLINIGWSLLIIYIAEIIIVFLYAIIFFFERAVLIPFFIISLIFAIVTAVINIKVLMSFMKGSYYDEKVF